MPAAEAILHVPTQLAEESEAILRSLGLSVDEAVRLFLAQVTLRRGLPFPVTLPRESSASEKHDDDLLPPSSVRQAVLDSFYDGT